MIRPKEEVYILEGETGEKENGRIQQAQIMFHDGFFGEVRFTTLKNPYTLSDWVFMGMIVNHIQAIIKQKKEETDREDRDYALKMPISEVKTDKSIPKDVVVVKNLKRNK